MDLITLLTTILVIAVTSAAAFIYSRKYVKSRVKFQIVEDKILLPEELLEQLLGEGKLDEALEVCHTYNLDSDPVYQALWLHSEFTSSCVYEYLTKVGNKTWVLEECLNRVPDDLEGTRTLLNFACTLTEYKCILDARSEPEEAYLPTDASELLSFDASKFDESQKTLIQIRLRTLQYLDRLNTFQHLLDGIESNFIGSEFIEFRDKPIVDAAIDFARSSRFHAITVLFTWHGDQVLPHWLSILDEIPEVISPIHYQNLLPECSVDSVYPWEQATLREKDWTEILFGQSINSQYSNLGVHSTDSPVTTANESISLQDNLSNLPSTSSTGASAAPVNTSVCVNRQKLTCWFIKRAKEIEKLTGSVEHCSLLLKYGLQRNLSSLRPLHDHLEQFASLLYDCLSRSNDTIYISYDEFKSFSVEKIVDSLLSSVNNVSTFISCVNRYVKPYLIYLLSNVKSDTGVGSSDQLISPRTLAKLNEQSTVSDEEAKESAVKLIEEEIKMLEALCLVALEFTDIKNIILPSDVRCRKSETLPLILPRSASAYKKVDVLDKVVKLLCPSECSHETILQMACEKAIQVDDTHVASDYMNQLIRMNSVSSWKLAYKLGNNDSIIFKDQRVKWLAYSLIYCDENKLLHILEKIDKLRFTNKSSNEQQPKRFLSLFSHLFNESLF